MKILFLSFYYPPDLSAGSFRVSSLVKSLLIGWPETVEIEVITTQPNRYKSIAKEAPTVQKHKGLLIRRIRTNQHNSSFLGQSIAFVAYLKGVLKAINGNDYDLIFATSGRLMTAFLGAYISRKLKKPLYLDIRDIFTDTIGDVLPFKFGKLLKPIFLALEHYTINASSKVNLVSAGFLLYFKKCYPNKEFHLFTNGIDNQFLKAQTRKIIKKNSKELIVLYAGNIGEGQGLHKIIPKLAKKTQGKLIFKIIGDGSRVSKLLSAVSSLGCKNVVYLPPVKRDALIKIYKSADILFLHLNDFNAFKKVLPSKLFEYAVTGKPIWAGVSGYGRDFITSKIENAAVFLPCNIDSALLNFKKLDIKTIPRTKFADEFARDKIMKNMAKQIVRLGQNDQ